MPKEHKCPHCGIVNVDDRDHAAKSLPEDAATGIGLTIVDAISPGLGALLRGASIAKTAKKMLSGVTIKCENCGREFQV